MYVYNIYSARAGQSVRACAHVGIAQLLCTLVPFQLYLAVRSVRQYLEYCSFAKLGSIYCDKQGIRKQWKLLECVGVEPMVIISEYVRMACGKPEHCTF